MTGLTSKKLDINDSWLISFRCCILLDGEVFLHSESYSLAHLDILVHTVLTASNLEKTEKVNTTSHGGGGGGGGGRSK